MKRIAAISMLTLAMSPILPAIAQEQSDPNVALIISVTAGALFEPDGAPTADVDDRLADLTAKLRELQSLDPQPFTAFAISPVLCDEARLIGSPSSKRFLDELRASAGTASVLVTPYAHARLAGLPAADIAEQLALGRDALERCVERRTTATVYPPDLSVDDHFVDAIGGIDLNQSFADADVPFTLDDITFIPSVTANAATDIDGLADRAANGRGLAIALELTGTPATTARALMSDTRVRPGSIEELLALYEPVHGLPFDDADEPPHLGDVRRADDAVDGFASFVTEENRLLAILRTVVARVASSAEWDGRGAVASSRARAVVMAVAREAREVSIHSEPVTFTAREGALPVTIANETGYPVRVRVRVVSSKLDFPAGDEQRVVIEPPGDTVTFDATTRSTGTFPTSVEVTSPDGEIRFDDAKLVVRSTAANLSAVVLTAGGAFFLIVWFAGRIRRRAVAQKA